jgi:dephospho-CoA kinase
MIILGLTGSIGMGKSVAAAMLRRLGVPVHDSDAAVYRLYGPGGAAVAPVEAMFPGVTRDGAIDRALLSRRVLGDTAALRRLERVVHALVRRESERFLARARRQRRRVVVLDVPLLFETRGTRRAHVVLVVSAPAFIQAARVLSRPGMDEAKLARVLALQMPDRRKRQLADRVIPSGLGRRLTLRHLARTVRLARAGTLRPRRRHARDRARYRDHRA